MRTDAERWNRLMSAISAPLPAPRAAVRLARLDADIRLWESGLKSARAERVRVKAHLKRAQGGQAPADLRSRSARTGGHDE
jgi:hypothetical protein